MHMLVRAFDMLFLSLPVVLIVASVSATSNSLGGRRCTSYARMPGPAVTTIKKKNTLIIKRQNKTIKVKTKNKNK